MHSPTKKRVVERLECRIVLSAMADIVFILDESGSQEIGFVEDGEALRPWVSQITRALEAKLTARGIGARPAAENRYGVLAFGHVEPRALTIDNEVFARADQIDRFLSQFDNEGSAEDGWEAVASAIGADSIGEGYSFRPGAAVQLIMVTDEGRQTPTKIGGLDSNGSSLFFEIVDQLRAHNLRTNRIGLDVHEDAVLTTVTDFFFDEFEIFDEFGFDPEIPIDEFQPTIFGIDPHILDGVDLDANQANAADDLLPDATRDELTVFTYRRSDDVITSDDPESVPFVLEAWHRSGDDLSQAILDPGVDYQQVRAAFAEPCVAVDCAPGNYNSEELDQDSDANGNEPIIGQDAFEAEEYAFLTWESRGTTWDFDVIRQEFQGWQNPADFESMEQAIFVSSANFGAFGDDTLIRAFNQAFIDDTFEKIRLQIVDFDQSGTIELAQSDTGTSDFTRFVDVADRLAEDPNFSIDSRLFDLDNDGTFVTADQSSIDTDDLNLLLRVLATQVGDVNLDYQFTSSDLVQVFERGEYEDGIAGNSNWLDGDWNGDFEFDSADFVVAFQANSFEQGYADRDSDGHIDILPVWAWQFEASFDADLGFYLPDWSDPRMQRRLGG